MTLKGYFLLARRADVPPERFSRHWLTVHGPMAPAMPAVVRYVQSHRLRPPQPLAALAARCPYEGLAELWAVDAGDFATMRRSPAYLERLRPDEAHFVDRARSDWLTTVEHVLVDHGRPAGVKLAFLARRRPGLSVEQFQGHWLHQHAPLVADTPGLVGYAQSHVTPESYEVAPPPWDGVGELWFDSVEAMVEGLGSRSFRVQRADAEQFLDLDTIAAFVAREYALIGAARHAPGAAEQGGTGGV